MDTNEDAEKEVAALKKWATNTIKQLEISNSVDVKGVTKEGRPIVSQENQQDINNLDIVLPPEK